MFAFMVVFQAQTARTTEEFPVDLVAEFAWKGEQHIWMLENGCHDEGICGCLKDEKKSPLVGQIPAVVRVRWISTITPDMARQGHFTGSKTLRR